MIVEPPVGHPLPARGRPDGDRPLIVFAHGLEDEWRTWSALAHRLAPRWRCVALDLPWRSGNDYAWRSEGSPGDWLDAGLGALGEVPALVVGHSFGANATLETLARGDRWPASAAVVLVTPFFRTTGSRLTWDVFGRSLAQFRAQIDEGLRVRLGDRLGALEPDVLDIMSAKLADRVGPAAFLAVFEQFAATEALALHRVTTPTLLVCGGDDRSLSRAQRRALTTRLPGMTVAHRDDYDHFCHIRRADEVAGLVERFADAAIIAADRIGPDTERVVVT